MSLAVAPPAWQPHVDTWVLVAAIAAAYAIAVVRVGPRYAEPGRAAGTRLPAGCFGLGVGAGWGAGGWPLHGIAERDHYSHPIVQHLVLSLVATPLLLLGTPAWMLRAILRPPSYLFRAVRFCARFLPALIVFNLVLVFTHWPALVDFSLRSGLAHFLIHALIFVSALVVW